MTATIKAAPSAFVQTKTEFNSNPLYFLNEDFGSVPASSIPKEFRRLSRFLPVIVLVPKSGVHDKTTQKKPGPNKPGAGFIDTSDVCLSLDAAKAWLRNPNATDTFEFGGVNGCFQRWKFIAMVGPSFSHLRNLKLSHISSKIREE